MTFDPSKVEDFLKVFNSVKEQIASFEGCEQVKVLQDVNCENVFFTHSHWTTVEDLERYRASDFFKKTWSSTKKLFIEKAQAWSLKIV